MADRTVRWGIAGPGAIAEKVVTDFVHVPDARVVAVGSRSAERAAAFGARHGIERCHGSYAQLLADPDVDVVYIATPHPQHLALGLGALRAGKAILVEKAFTATLAGAEELVAEARRQGVFAMEAMWTRFQPAVLHARELVADGAIGELRSVQADLGVMRPFNASERSFARELGGGALLDLGVYVVSFAQMLLGDAVSVATLGSLEPTAVDAEAHLLVGFESGTVATLMCSLHSPMPGHARIFGTTGWIDVQPRFHHPRSIVLHRDGHESELITREPLGAGYAHELIEVTECLVAGRTESSIMPLADTLAVQRILQSALDDLGVVLQEDPNVL